MLSLPPHFLKHLNHALGDFLGSVGLAELVAAGSDFNGSHGHDLIQCIEERLQIKKLESCLDSKRLSNLQDLKEKRLYLRACLI